MIYLNAKQRKFLKHIQKVGEISYKDLSTEQIKIFKFLEENHLIDVEYNSFPKFDFQTKKPYYSKGECLSATISESGKAYLSERKSDRFRFLIPTIISVLALLASLLSTIIAYLAFQQNIP